MKTTENAALVAVLTSPKVEAKVAELVAEQQRNDQIGKMAAADPLPGPAKEAFALKPDIEVGPYKVRPFYDYDFELLAALKHPLHNMMVNAMAGKASDLEFEPRGEPVWNLAFMLTRTPDEVDQIIDKGGLPAFKAAAKKEFSRLQIAALTTLVKAAALQMRGYWAPTLGYGPQEGEQSPNPNQSSAKP